MCGQTAAAAASSARLRISDVGRTEATVACARPPCQLVTCGVLTSAEQSRLRRRRKARRRRQALVQLRCAWWRPSWGGERGVSFLPYLYNRTGAKRGRYRKSTLRRFHDLVLQRDGHLCQLLPGVLRQRRRCQGLAQLPEQNDRPRRMTCITSGFQPLRFLAEAFDTATS